MTGLQLFDMHCHLDFAPDARAAARGLAKRGAGAFSVTVEPSGFERSSALLAGCENMRVGLGLHPWWVAEGRCGEADVEAFARLARATRFIGEVGLDFGKRCEGAREAQVAAFARVVAACADGGRVLSVHAVRATADVLDALAGAGALGGNAVVFHWFSGTSDELGRAVDAGCFFSLNPRMLASRRGRAYARAIPEDRLLLETDAPGQPGDPYDPAVEVALLERMLADLADLRAVSRGRLAVRIAETGARLLDF